MLESQENLVVANWWIYDSDTNMLYYDITENDESVFKKTRTFFFAEYEIGEGWIVPSENENRYIVLWNNNELTVGNELVAEIVKWDLLAMNGDEILANFTFGINAAVIDGKQPWVWEEGFPIVTLRGYYRRDGGYFEDPISLIIPLETGGMVAVGKSRGRHYYLHTTVSAIYA